MDSVKYLLKMNADPNIIDYGGNTTLIKACSNDNIEIPVLQRLLHLQFEIALENLPIHPY